MLLALTHVRCAEQSLRAGRCATDLRCGHAVHHDVVQHAGAGRHRDVVLRINAAEITWSTTSERMTKASRSFAQMRRIINCIVRQVCTAKVEVLIVVMRTHQSNVQHLHQSM